MPVRSAAISPWSPSSDGSSEVAPHSIIESVTNAMLSHQVAYRHSAKFASETDYGLLQRMNKLKWQSVNYWISNKMECLRSCPAREWERKRDRFAFRNPRPTT